jgi:hypothetical protein
LVSDEDEDECLTQNSSPLLAKMNLTSSGAEEQKSSLKCGKSSTKDTISDDFIRNLASKMTSLIKEHSVMIQKEKERGSPMRYVQSPCLAPTMLPPWLCL